MALGVKTRSFSIYLLKKGQGADNSLKDGHALDDQVLAEKLPEGSKLYLLDNNPTTPWWKSYFHINKDLLQVHKGAILFLPIEQVTFAIMFGHVSHNLIDSSYEYDFGLRVTLNCVDPNKLKSTDILEPNGAKRQRTQLPIDSDLTYFDFDKDSTILKTLTGKVKSEYKALFKHATGASNIRISSDVSPDGLKELCEKLYQLYLDNSYELTFPDIQNISPVKDPIIVHGLNSLLVDGLSKKVDEVSLSVPEIIDFNEGLWATFSGVGQSLIYDDVFIGKYYEYLEEHKFDLATISVEELKKHALILTDQDGNPKSDRYSIFKCLIFDTIYLKQVYHLSEGNWYRVAEPYIERLKSYLDPLCEDTTLSPFNHASEGAYNQAMVIGDDCRVCLDMKNIAPKGQKQIEPCDIFELKDGTGWLHHVKISTLSAQLSHLFNQGTNSIAIIRDSDESVANLKALADALAPVAQKQNFANCIDLRSFRVLFEIITHKPKNGKSDNLPLFSRISLMRCMKDIRRMGISAAYCFIEDNSPPSDGKKKKRKPKQED